MNNHGSRPNASAIASSSSSFGLATTTFRVIASHRQNFLRTDLTLLIEQSLAGVMDGVVVDAFRFETRYSELVHFRACLCQYVRKLYRNDAIPPLPEILSNSPPQVIEEAHRSVETLLGFIYERKYLVESPLFKAFMHHKKRQKVDPSARSDPPLEQQQQQPQQQQQMVPLVDMQQTSSGNVANKYMVTPNVSLQDYLIEAGALLIGARRNEFERKYSEAYELYKLAIQTLLEGARQDPDTANVTVVKRKIAMLLDTTDRLYETHLADGCQAETATTNPSSPDFAMAELKQLFKDYKIIGINGKIIVLQDKDSGKKQAVKILRKSTRVQDTDPIVPTDIERMVRLASLHETESSILLMLEYVSGGTLFSHIDLLDCYPPSLAKNPSPLDPSASILNPSKHQPLSHQDSSELVLRRWSLNLSSSDWSSAMSHSRHRTHTASGTTEPGSKRGSSHGLIEDNEGEAQLHKGTDFDQVLSEVNRTTTAAQFSIDAEASTSSMSSPDHTTVVRTNSDSAFVDQSQPSQLASSQSTLTTATASRENNAPSDGAKTEKKKLPAISDVCRWALQVLEILEALHRYGFIWEDMNPNNILYDPTDDGVKLTFVCRWSSVESKPPNDDAVRNGYVAPELIGPFAVTEHCVASDFWSFGAFIFNLLVGCSVGTALGDMQSSVVSQYLDSEIADVIKLRVADNAAADLLLLLMKKNPSERLCAYDKIRAHPLFSSYISS